MRPSLFVCLPVPVPVSVPVPSHDLRLARGAQFAVPLFDAPPPLVVRQIEGRLGLAARLNRAQHACALPCVDCGATADAAIAALLPPPQDNVRSGLGRC
jgi:hypothetical protein